MQTEERLSRIERMLSKVLREVPPKQPSRISEQEAMARFQVGRDHLKVLRRGKGEKLPVLFKWGHIRGRKIDYDVKELEQYFKRQFHI